MANKLAESRTRRLFQEVGIYIVVGIANTCLSVVLLWLLYGLGWPYPVYTALVYGIMILISFELNRRFTFATGSTSTKQWRRWLRSFCILHLLNLVLIQSVQAALIEGAHLPQYVGVSAGLLIGILVGFIGSRWVFQSDLREDSPCRIRRCANTES